MPPLAYELMWQDRKGTHDCICGCGVKIPNSSKAVYASGKCRVKVMRKFDAEKKAVAAGGYVAPAWNKRLEDETARAAAQAERSAKRRQPVAAGAATVTAGAATVTAGAATVTESQPHAIIGQAAAATVTESAADGRPSKPGKSSKRKDIEETVRQARKARLAAGEPAPTKRPAHKAGS